MFCSTDKVVTQFMGLFCLQSTSTQGLCRLPDKEKTRHAAVSSVMSENKEQNTMAVWQSI